MRRNSFRLLAIALTLQGGIWLVPPADAQMVLPGAVTPTPAGTPVSPQAAKPKRTRPRAAAPDELREAPPAIVRAPVTLIGQTFFLNGRKSQISFVEHDKAPQVSKLTLAGTRTSSSSGECQVDVPGTPLPVTDLGRPNGVARIRIEFPACPIVFDVLDGAVLAVGDPPSCDLSAQACKVSPAGLWGPQAGAIGPADVKTIEKARAQAELAVRTDFKLLMTTTRDHPTISDYAREQAGFSSAREEICRDYAGEGRHGFCATRLTQARAAALRAKYEAEAANKPQRKKARAGK